MLTKKFYEPCSGELRRDYYMPNAMSSKCGYLNYGPSLVPANQFTANESEINNQSWGHFECPLSNLHHHHTHHYGPYGHHGYHNFNSHIHGDNSYGNVNELSPTTGHEHVINLYDLYATTNRSLDYQDCNYGEQTQHTAAESFAYNQEEYYCCNVEETPISWLESEACRTWDSQSHEPPVAPNQHLSPSYGNPGVVSLPYGNPANGVESNAYLNNFETKCELDKFGAIHKSPPSFQTGPSVFACSSSNYLPFKECKSMQVPTGTRVNLAMNMAMPLVESKPTLSSIQMRTHSTKYKLMSQLGERITIKEHHHNFTDVYRINKEGPTERHNFCKAKTLYSQRQHIRIDHRVDPSIPPASALLVESRPNQPITEPQLASTGTLDSKSIGGNNLCRICHKKYARPSTLKTHLRTHSGEKPYRCHICCKSFSQAANLTAHIRTHTHEKPFPCPICKRHFSQSSSVTTHLRTHSGEKPYSCRFCRKSFSDSSTLTKHLRIHSGEKPYQCQMCGIKFSQSGNLNRHMRVHIIHS